MVVVRRGIVVLRGLILKHQCALGDHRHATPAGYRRAYNVWLELGREATAKGRIVNREITELHREGIF
jgi:hypothetical protein